MRQQTTASLFFSMFCVCREIQFSDKTVSGVGSDLHILRPNSGPATDWRPVQSEPCPFA